MESLPNTLPPREARKTADSTFDRIYKSCFGKIRVELNEKETRIKARWEMCFELLCNMQTEREVLKMLQTKFKIGQHMAYNDIKNTKLLFGDRRNTDKEFKRKQSEEWTLWALSEAKKTNNLEAVDKFLGKFNKINGLDIENDIEYADMVKKLTPTALVFTITVDKLKEEADSLMDNIPSQDIEFEDITDEGKG